jgi:DNA-directed RNA polymerase subunit RPC12/RpoP
MTAVCETCGREFETTKKANFCRRPKCRALRALLKRSEKPVTLDHVSGKCGIFRSGMDYEGLRRFR